MGLGSSSSSRRTNMPPPLILPATARHTASVIFLHGLGDTGHGWRDMFAQMRSPHIKYIFPNAPEQPVTLNAGMVMPSWFDIKGLSADAPSDEEGIKKSAAILSTLVSEEEKAGVPAERILVGGFSQGGAISIYSALTSGKKYGALVALSTWLPLHNKIAQLANVGGDIPLLQCHGKADPLVPFLWGQASHQHLQTIFPRSKFFPIEGLGHSSSPQEMAEVKKFIDEYLPAQ